MGLITKSVKISPRGKMISYYRTKGYDFNYGDEVEISIEDLSDTSRALVDCTCDYCNVPLSMTYKAYKRSINSPTHKVACNNCKGKKTIESNLIVYGVRSVAQLQEVQEKFISTMQERYGVSNPAYYESFVDKRKKSCIENLGVDCPFKSNIVREKAKKSMMNRFGFDNPFQVPKILEKIRNTCLDKYGTEHFSQTDECKKRFKQTCLQRYGVQNPSQIEEIKAKKVQSCLNHYGCENPNQSHIVRKKSVETMFRNQTTSTSKQQLYIHNLYGGELNGVVSYYNCDIVFRDEKLICEVDLGGHDLCVKIGASTEKEFKRKEYLRDRNIKSEGFRIIRIISRKDYLPSDTILLQMLQYARDFFTQNPQRSWISFDIDSSCIYNAYHKESEGGIPYDFGSLRKIKKSDLQCNTLTTPSTTLSSPTLPLNSITP